MLSDQKGSNSDGETCHFCRGFWHSIKKNILLQLLLLKCRLMGKRLFGPVLASMSHWLWKLGTVPGGLAVAILLPRRSKSVLWVKENKSAALWTEGGRTHEINTHAYLHSHARAQLHIASPKHTSSFGASTPVRTLIDTIYSSAPKLNTILTLKP